MNNPSKASQKFKKFQEKFMLDLYGGELCLYRRQTTNWDDNYYVLIPTVEEELELLVKCHREECHDQDGASFMRDMLTSNCHITNLVKKLDYLQSICKLCKGAVSDSL